MCICDSYIIECNPRFYVHCKGKDNEIEAGYIQAPLFSC